MIDRDDQIHRVKSFMGGLARTTCHIYVNATQVTAYKDEATCPSCLEGKTNPVLGWDE